MDQMVLAMRTLAHNTIYQELVLILLRDHLSKRNALQEIGLQFTGKDISRMEERSLTQELNQEVSQKLSLLEHAKFSTAGILLSLNSIREIRHVLIAHPTLLMVELILRPQLEVSQFLFILISILILRFLTAIEFQSSPNNLHNQLQPLCNQEDACTFTRLPLLRRAPHLLLLVKILIIESVPLTGVTIQQLHATWKSGLRKILINNSSTMKILIISMMVNTTSSFAIKVVIFLFAISHLSAMVILHPGSGTATWTGIMMVSPKPCNILPGGVCTSHMLTIPTSGPRFTSTML